MLEISEAEFRNLGVYSMNLPFYTEKRWFKHDDLLGTVVFDNVDNDWAWVALAKAETGQYVAFDVGHSLTSAGAATKALDAVLQKGLAHKTKTELLVEAAIENSGMTNEQFEQELRQTANDWAARTQRKRLAD